MQEILHTKHKVTQIASKQTGSQYKGITIQKIDAQRHASDKK